MSIQYVPWKKNNISKYVCIVAHHHLPTVHWLTPLCNRGTAQLRCRLAAIRHILSGVSCTLTSLDEYDVDRTVRVRMRQNRSEPRRVPLFAVTKPWLRMYRGWMTIIISTLSVNLAPQKSGRRAAPRHMGTGNATLLFPSLPFLRCR